MDHLVVIDMQAEFHPAQGVIHGCKIAIKNAVAQGFHIIFLEYNNWGNTLSELMALVENYPNHNVFKKSSDSGAELLKHWIKDDYPIWFCGVNLCACVSSTIYNTIRNDLDENIDRDYYLIKNASGCHSRHKWEINRGSLRNGDIKAANNPDGTNWPHDRIWKNMIDNNDEVYIRNASEIVSTANTFRFAA